MPVSVVILAAGLSRRMGFPKALLRYQGLSFIQWTTKKALNAKCDQIIITTADSNEGYPFKKSDALKELQVVLKEHFKKIKIVKGCSSGQPIDSLRYAITKVPRENAILLWPIDYPFAEEEMLKSLFARIETAPHQILVPDVHGKRGHPVLFGKDLKNELLSPLANQGAHSIVNRDPQRVVLLPTKNTNIARNINTPQQAEALGIKVH